MSITSVKPATLPAALERPVDPAGAVENARDTLGVDCGLAEGAFPTTPWTPQTAPTGSTGSTGTFVVLSIKTSR